MGGCWLPIPCLTNHRNDQLAEQSGLSQLWSPLQQSQGELALEMGYMETEEGGIVDKFKCLTELGSIFSFPSLACTLNVDASCLSLGSVI